MFLFSMDRPSLSFFLFKVRHIFVLLVIITIPFLSFDALILLEQRDEETQSAVFVEKRIEVPGDQSDFLLYHRSTTSINVCLTNNNKLRRIFDTLTSERNRQRKREREPEREREKMKQEKPKSLQHF